VAPLLHALWALWAGEATVSFALAVTTDGREECLERAVESLRASLDPWPDECVMVDDSGDPDFAAVMRYVDYTSLVHEQRRGFAAAVESVWREVIRSGAEYVFHAEDDFTYNEPVDLMAMASLLDAHPHIAQLALKRQPVNAEEQAAGGFMQTKPGEFIQRDGWIEHETNFTTNPSLIPARVIQLALRSGRPLSEPNVTDTLLEHGYRFGYLGRIEDEPRVEHIGHERMAGWME